MQYLLLIYGNESQFDKMSPTEQNKILQEYGEFSNSIAGSGHLRGGNELDRISKAKTVRVRQGKRSVLDGPFAETKEQLGGYYLVEAKDCRRGAGPGRANPFSTLGFDRSPAHHSA